MRLDDILDANELKHILDTGTLFIELNSKLFNLILNTKTVEFICFQMSMYI